MKTYVPVFTALAAISAIAFAASPAPNLHPLRLGDIVAHMESKYRGNVTAIEFDGSGDKRPHYHVDLRFPQGKVARLDVDAVTRETGARNLGHLSPGSATLAEVTTLVASQLPGQVIAAELDLAGNGVAPHYDLDVRVQGGKIARIKVDPTTRWIGWRQPAVVDE